jgi:ribosomal-protein-alanine N-acetyltransferase
MARFLAAAAGRADTAFLDVAADNTPALALYHGAGFAETGRRPAYFARPGRPAADAILMARALRKS